MRRGWEQTGQFPLGPKLRGAYRGVTRALIGGGGGGEYSYIRVLPDEFLFKSVVVKLNILKEISRAEHEYSI